MSYYFIAATTKHDADMYLEYQQKALPGLLENNCKPLSVNADFKIVHQDAKNSTGDAEPNVIILFEFPSEQDFDNWWYSDEYAEIATIRHASATAWFGFGVKGDINLPSSELESSPA